MLLIVFFFVFIFVTVLACVGFGLSLLKSKQKQQIRSMLRKVEESPSEQRSSQLVREAEIQNLLTKALARFKFTDRLELILEQAGKNWTPSKFTLVSCATFAIGYILGLKFHFIAAPQLAGFALGALGGSMPLLLILRKRRKNIAAFEEQFPEALDFLARSMRAGHGFSIAMELLSTDSPDPLGGAFRRVSNDLQLGASLDAAFGKLLVLIPLIDVRFFVSSVLLQQETGGNLGEILTKLAQIIRERFRLKGQVQAASAHGRVTGLVLVLMPAAVVAFMCVSSPQYLLGMAAEQMGRYMIYGAIGGQVIGYFVIQKIVNIKV